MTNFKLSTSTSSLQYNRNRSVIDFASRCAVLAAAVLLSAQLTVYADVIYLKDGTKIESPKAWEENGVVRFYLKDTSNIVVSYSSDIVDRIVSGDEDVSVQPSSEDTTPNAPADKELPDKEKQPTLSNDPSEAASPSAADQEPNASPADSGPTAQPAQIASHETSPISSVDPSDQASVATPYDGIAFYDPRREYKYWTSERSHHNTLKAAIGSLAMEFNRSPEWVEQNMGDTNDLGQIYRNLSKPLNQTTGSPSAGQTNADGILFYNPRRPYKYWVSSTAKFSTFNEAVEALAKQFNTSPDWIVDNMGETNDLGEIQKNLMESKIRESGLDELEE